MPKPKRQRPVNNPDLERVMNDIRGNKQTGQPANPFTGVEGSALNAVDQSIRGTSGNPFRGAGNPYNPSQVQRGVSNDILGNQQTGKITNPFASGTIEGDALNAVGQSAWGNSGNPFQDVGNLNPYNPSPAQRGIFKDIRGSNGFVEIPPPLEERRKLPVKPERRLGELYPFGENYSATQAEDEKIRSMSLEDKLIKAMRLSISSGQLSKQTQAELLKILNPNNLPALALLLGVWGAGHLIGAGQVVDAFMLGFMLGTLGTRGIEAMSKLWSFFSGAQNAVTQNDLKLAAEDFAGFVSIITTEGLTAFVGAKGATALKELQSHLGQAFPKFKGLSVEQQKFVIEALEASRRAAGDVGKRVGSKFSPVATEAKGWLDATLGKRKPATASNEGSRGNGEYRQQSNEGQSRGQASASLHPWREKLIENIESNNKKWKTEKNVVNLVKRSIGVLENLRSFPVKNSKGKIVKVPFGSQGTNLAVQRLNNLAIDKVLPLRKDIEELLKRLSNTKINNTPLLNSMSEYKILERSINAIDDHLRPDDLIGALRDNLGVPVVVEGRTFQHITETNQAIESLANLQMVLNHFLQRTRTPNLFEVGKHGQGFEKSAIEIQKSIGQVIKQIEVIKSDYKNFIDLKSYYQGYSISINAPSLDRSIRYKYHNPGLTIALEMARSSSINNESLSEFRKTLAEAKLLLQQVGSIAETKKVTDQENIITSNPEVRKSRGFEMG